DDRALAGTVLAEQAVDRAALDRQVGVVEREHARVQLDQPAGFDPELRGRGRHHVLEPRRLTSTAAIRIPPWTRLITYVSNLSMISPVWITPRKRTPTTVPGTLNSPGRKTAAPRKTAANAGSR